jgi:uncharacterized membrane protein YhaH (DUF805 family)
MHWFLEALRRYAEFNGRSRRAEYWWFTLFTWLILIVVVALGVSLRLPAVVGGSLLVLVWLALLVPTWAVTARRLHDIGRSGWLQAISYVPVLGWIGGLVILALCVAEGDRGPNRYGRDPKDPAIAHPGAGGISAHPPSGAGSTG